MSCHSHFLLFPYVPMSLFIRPWRHFNFYSFYKMPCRTSTTFKVLVSHFVFYHMEPYMWDLGREPMLCIDQLCANCLTVHFLVHALEVYFVNYMHLTKKFEEIVTIEHNACMLFFSPVKIPSQHVCRCMLSWELRWWWMEQDCQGYVKCFQLASAKKSAI